jgi:hypothetical protein
MSRFAAVVLALSAIGFCATTPQYLYLPHIQQRWDVSDLVCTAVVTAPVSTGVIRLIGGADRDQLSAEATIERCFKGEKPSASTIKVIGYSVYAAKDLHGGGIGYSGPPIGFVGKGRNLLFLRRTASPHTFDIAVPIYETALRLSDSRPHYPDDNSAVGIRFALTQEFGAAILQSDSLDIYYMGWLFDWLGSEDAMHELRTLSHRAPLAIQRDIAVTLFAHGQPDLEPIVISLLTDTSALAWKRENAAALLGEHGTQRALPYLRQVAAQPATNDDLKALRNWTVDAIRQLECRLETVNCRAPVH